MSLGAGVGLNVGVSVCICVCVCDCLLLLAPASGLRCASYSARSGGALVPYREACGGFRVSSVGLLM